MQQAFNNSQFRRILLQPFRWGNSMNLQEFIWSPTPYFQKNKCLRFQGGANECGSLLLIHQYDRANNKVCQGRLYEEMRAKPNFHLSKNNGHLLQRQSMGARERPVAVSRLKREDCVRTKHDSHFSNWKVLVGPLDWKEYSVKAEGAERYRVHNLPPSSGSGPGVYELGIAVPLSPNASGRDVLKLDQHRIVVAYLGQAENVRSRLQQYGRTGAHLGRGCSIALPDDSKIGSSLSRGPGLFETMFSKGYFITYRWTPMKSKREAEETEARLLKTFDYAWNKGSNGARRPDDILEKLNEIASTNNLFTKLYSKLQRFSQKQVGIRIKTSEEINNLPLGVFKHCSSRPRLVSNMPETIEEPLSVCGVMINDGMQCKRPTVSGRKRCEEHKGRRVHGSDSSDHRDNESSCGVYLGDGVSCRRQPVVGRKRCEEHKGMRVNGLTSKLA